MRDCTKVRDINPTNGLCPGCVKTVFGTQPIKRQEALVRQSNERAQAQDQHRDLNISLSPTPSSSGSSAPLPGAAPLPNGAPPPSTAPPADNLINFPHISSANTTTTPSAPPMMDIPSLQNTYSQMVSGGPQSQNPQMLTDMYGMLLNVLSKQTENDHIKEEVRSNSDRIRELENKVGKAEEVSEKLGIGIRNLPMPASGKTELENVRAALYEVKAPGVDVARDVTKAIRVGSKEDYLGTVKVELLNDETRASIMKQKKFLINHQNPVMRNLYIKNLKSEDQMRMENFARDMLKMLPDGNNYFVAGNGHLRQKDFPQQAHQAQYRAPAPQAQGPRPQVTLPYRPQVRQQAPQARAQAPHDGGYQAPPQSVVQVQAPVQTRPPAPQQTYQLPNPSQFAYHFQPNVFNPYQQNLNNPLYHIRAPAPVSTQHQAPNPLDMFDPFQSLAALPTPVNVSLSHGAQGQPGAQQQHQQASDSEQAAVPDRDQQGNQ